MKPTGPPMLAAEDARDDPDRPAPVSEPDPPGTVRHRSGYGWHWLLVPLIIYAASRSMQFMLLAWMAPGDGTLTDRLLVWDAGWFQRIAEDGYPTRHSYDISGEITGSALAFFPGYPLVIRAAHGLGPDYPAAALAVAWISAAVLVVLVYALGTHLYDRRVGTVLTALFCTQPMSVVLSMGYSEPLFLAFAVGSLLAAYRRRWVVAGLVGLAAGLTRPTGAAVTAALAVAALLHVADRANGSRRWWALTAPVLALPGVPGYLAWVDWRVGDTGAWFKIQTSGWGTRFDFGAATWRFVVDTLRAGDGWLQVSVAWLLIAALVAVLLAVRARVWTPLIVYGVIALVLVVGQAGYYHSKPRLLVPVLLTLVPVALALARVRWRTALAVLAGFAFFGLWYGAYLLAVWPYAI